MKDTDKLTNLVFIANTMEIFNHVKLCVLQWNYEYSTVRMCVAVRTKAMVM
jgi:hypothetical protein